MSAPEDVTGVVLAAGLGTRLAPLTTLRPKALCPVANRPLLDHALDRLDSLGLFGPRAVAVNAHSHADAVAAAVGDRATLSVESPAPLGSAGALGALRGWLDGRAALVTNVDAYLDGAVAAMLAGWDGRRVRLLVTYDPPRADFGHWRFAGCSLLPARLLDRLAPEPAGLYETCWRPALDAGEADLVPYAGTFVDCGTPADYLAANLHASGGVSVVAPDAVVDGVVVRSVVWPGSRVDAGEHLVDVIRADGLTVQAGPLGPSTTPAAPADDRVDPAGESTAEGQQR